MPNVEDGVWHGGSRVECIEAESAPHRARLARAPPKKLSMERRSRSAQSKAKLHAHRPPADSPPTTPRHGRRSTAPAAREAAQGPVHRHLGAAVLELVHLGAAPRPVAALVAGNAHLDPASAARQLAHCAARPVRSHHRITCADLLLQNAQGCQDHLALRRRRHCALRKPAQRWPYIARGR